MSNNKLTTEQKILAGFGTLPVNADLLEDIKFDKSSKGRVMKMEVNKLINQIRRIDQMFLDLAVENKAEIIEQSHNIQLWFRQQIKENFK